MDKAEAYFLSQNCSDVDLAGWSDLIPAHATVLRLTLFADVILRAADGSIHMLEVAADSCSPICATEQEFWNRVAADEDGWQFRPLADKCREAGLGLEPGQCYAFKIPPFMGGAYAPDNVWVSPIRRWLDFLADLHAQTKDLPDGSAIRLNVVE